MMPGHLVLIPTPIGNLGDLSPRVRQALQEVDVLACEDTRRTRTLYQALGLKPPACILAYHDHNERQAAPGLVQLLQQGQSVGLVSDAGTPLISDPGYRLVRLAVEKGIPLETLPGPSAVLAALALSGLPPSSFTFKGFAPRKPGARRRWLEQDRDAVHTLILFESAQRLKALLRDVWEVWGEREAALCAELTKKFERVFRGRLSELLETDLENKGEFTVVIAGRDFS